MLVDGVCRVSSAFFFLHFLIHAFVITWVANHGFVLRILVLFSLVYGGGIMHTLDTDSDWSLLFYFLLSF